MRALLLIVLLFPAHAGASTPPSGDEPVVGGPCEGCERVFDGMPQSFVSDVRIAPRGTEGDPLRIEGRAVTAQGAPAPGIVVYAYHTDARGIYPEGPGASGRHGTLRAWAVSDAEGRFVFRTIRPASYPGTRVAQHVHLHVIEPGRCTYWIDEIVFDDDPFFRAPDRGDVARGGSGVTSPRRDADGVWVVEREIVLGRAVPGYARVDGP